MSYGFPPPFQDKNMISFLVCIVTIDPNQISNAQSFMPFAIVARTYQSQPEIYFSCISIIMRSFGFCSAAQSSRMNGVANNYVFFYIL